ncbi:MAG: lantibiotic dehydratase family protein [Pseudonocardia sp.]|nr:lantibiotic dehydratase family protein [Pseudonocardia sp.]
MSTGSEVIGGSGMLRVAGLPVSSWLAAAAPDLFAGVRAQETARARYVSAAARAAEVLGTRLVPRPELSARERAVVLSLRRRLHRAELPVTSGDCAMLTELATRLCGPCGSAVEACAELTTRAAVLTLAAHAVDSALVSEQERLDVLPLEIVASSPVARRALARSSPETYRAVIDEYAPPRRSAKRMRERRSYLWQLVTRAATSSTPRDWLSHAALLRVDGAAAGQVLRLGPRIADAWMENLYEVRGRAPSAADCRSDIGRLALAPLRRAGGERLHFWGPREADGAAGVAETTLVRTALLDAVTTALADQLLTVFELERLLQVRADESVAFRAFMTHLCSIGAVQVSVPPARRPARWMPMEPSADHATGGDQHQAAGWLDVYRRLADPLPASVASDVQRSIEQVVRVLGAIGADSAAGRTDSGEEHDDRSGPLLDLLVRDTTAHVASAHRPATWQPGRDPSSPYSALLRWLGDRLDGAVSVDVGAALLDSLGVARIELDWPVDCILRVSAPGDAACTVLNEVVPAGSLDARFATELERLHGEVPQVRAYRAFLEEMSQRSGVPFVEVLVPPLSGRGGGPPERPPPPPRWGRAPTPVRPPRYTRLWTGDPDSTSYLDGDQNTTDYVPLSAICLRRSARRLVAEVEGKQIWPIYHATRSVQPPWDRLSHALLAAGPRPTGWVPRRLQYSLGLFPERTHMPRITVASMVVSPEQWRIVDAELWDPEAPLAARIHALERLRRTRGLPRWIVVLGPGARGVRACDLESLFALRTVERAARPLIVAEMLPAPDELLITAPDGPHVSEVLLRLPCDASPAALADRALASWPDRGNRCQR